MLWRMRDSEGEEWLTGAARGNQNRGCKLIGLLLLNMALIRWKEGHVKLFLRGKALLILVRFQTCLYAKVKFWASWEYPQRDCWEGILERELCCDGSKRKTQTMRRCSKEREGDKLRESSQELGRPGRSRFHFKAASIFASNQSVLFLFCFQRA